MKGIGFDAVPVEMDQSDQTSIQALIAEGQKYGKIKMPMNAAGVIAGKRRIGIFDLQKCPFCAIIFKR